MSFFKLYNSGQSHAPAFKAHKSNPASSKRAPAKQAITKAAGPAMKASSADIDETQFTKF
jgi:hypothetical protein